MSVYALSGMSSIQLNDVAFSRNNFKGSLLAMRSNCSAIIQNNTLTRNNISWIFYCLYGMSTIQLNDMEFTRNNFRKTLLFLSLNCSAIIKNNSVTENNLSETVCHLYKISSIQLNDLTFTRNKESLPVMVWNCSTIMQNDELTKNNASVSVYALTGMNSAQLNNMAITQNNVKGNSLLVLSNCSTTVKVNEIFLFAKSWRKFSARLKTSKSIKPRQKLMYYFITKKDETKLHFIWSATYSEPCQTFKEFSGEK